MEYNIFWDENLYVSVMEKYKDIVDLKTGLLFSQNGKTSTGIDDKYEHIPSRHIEQYLKVLYNFNKDASFLDIGSGLGNILHLAKLIGFNDVSGIECNISLKKYNHGLNVTWGDIYANTEILKGKKLIYLFRPYVKDEDMDKLLNFIYKHSDEDVIIFYNYPHVKYKEDINKKCCEFYYYTHIYGCYGIFFKNKEFQQSIVDEILKCGI